jgi:arylsulfatase A-like enzyme
MLALAAILASAASPQPDIFLISVDTLRADRLGCYGYELPTTPNLDRFAAESLLFEDAICEVPLTGPSFSSMLTSHFPRTTGATKNGIRIPDWAPTVPELLKTAGYETVCVQSNWTLKGKLCGLNRGFDVYDDDMDSKRWGVLKPERVGDDVLERALELLENRDTAKPLFAWFHFSDPHAPYKLHEDYNPWGTRTAHLDEVDSVRARYDSEVAFTDAQIAHLLEALPTKNRFIIFVGDHGESLYEHDYLGHGRRVHQTGLHVPLMINGPSIAPGRSDAPVRGIDVGTTLMAVAGLQPLKTMEGFNLLNQEVIARDRLRVVETYGGAVPQIAGIHGLLADKPPMRQSAIWAGWKLIQLGPETELYNLKSDPRELENHADDMPEKVAEMSAKIETWSEATLRSESDEATLNEDDVEALESLGYVD